MEHYATLFDSTFLPQGLALYSSLERTAGDFVLWVLCVDDKAKRILDTLNKPNIRTISLPEIETDELRVVKTNRTRGEYCWTLTPFVPKLVFERAAIAQRVTYVDADMFFLTPATTIFEEFEKSGKAVLITEHAYYAEYDLTETSGRFCVQFITFQRDTSEPVRRWWQDRCIEWCHARLEDGKFGDQKYLDDWPWRFQGLVHVNSQIDAFLAPWNARRFPYSRAVAWHFHGLRLLKNRRVLLHGHFNVPEVAHRVVYSMYLIEITQSLNTIGEDIIQGKIGNSLIRYGAEVAWNFLNSVRRMFRAQRTVWRLPPSR